MILTTHLSVLALWYIYNLSRVWPHLLPFDSWDSLQHNRDPVLDMAADLLPTNVVVM